MDPDPGGPKHVDPWDPDPKHCFPVFLYWMESEIFLEVEKYLGEKKG